MKIEKRAGTGPAPAPRRRTLPDRAPALLERAWVSDRLGIVLDVEPVSEAEVVEQCEPRRFEELKPEPVCGADGWLWMVNGAPVSLR